MPDFQYQPFYQDFGPLSLLQVHLFLIVALDHLSNHDCLVHFYCSPIVSSVANSIFLAASFRLISLQVSPHEALQPFADILTRLPHYRDASSFPSTFDLPISACIHGLARAMRIGWYDPNTFDPRHWAELEPVERGDMNWLIPDKLLAFASPYHTNLVQGFRVCTPGDIVPTLKQLNIDTIIRLNNPTYDETAFKEAGFTHLEMYFPDGSLPPDALLWRFLEIVEGPAIIALHCKAGLGRT